MTGLEFRLLMAESLPRLFPTYFHTNIKCRNADIIIEFFMKFLLVYLVYIVVKLRAISFVFLGLTFERHSSVQKFSLSNRIPYGSQTLFGLEQNISISVKLKGHADKCHKRSSICINCQINVHLAGSSAKNTRAISFSFAKYSIEPLRWPSLQHLVDWLKQLRTKRPDFGTCFKIIGDT